jgi:hypothetical protein
VDQEYTALHAANKALTGLTVLQLTTMDYSFTLTQQPIHTYAEWKEWEWASVFGGADLIRCAQNDRSNVPFRTGDRLNKRLAGLGEEPALGDVIER